MQKYQLRKNYFFSGKIAFKTKQINWEGTNSPVVIPISIHSKFHQGVVGALKMQALISTIKENVRGEITLLLTERAHANENQFDALQDAYALTDFFQECFQNCKITYWHSYINADMHYKECYQKVLDLYHTDATFQSFIHKEGKNSSARADLIEQSTALLVLKKKGYCFQFYPGKQYEAIEYLNELENPIDLIHVFLSIEKKQL